MKHGKKYNQSVALLGVYAAEFSPNAITAVIISGKSRIAKITKNIINSCKAIGVPRITATYKLQINFGTLIHFDGFAIDSHQSILLHNFISNSFNSHTCYTLSTRIGKNLAELLQVTSL